MRQFTPYLFVFVGLIVGLVILQSEPISNSPLNYLVGGSFLALALASLTYLIIASSGPDKRRPDF